MSKNVTLTQEQFKKLESLYPELHGVIKSLENVVHPDIVKKLKTMEKKMVEVFEDHWKQTKEDEDANYEALSKVSAEHRLQTTWSISEVPASMLEKTMGTIKEITYESWGEKQTRNYGKRGKKVTWLQAWQIADEMIRSSGDTHHIFVEGFVHKGEGVYELATGS